MADLLTLAVCAGLLLLWAGGIYACVKLLSQEPSGTAGAVFGFIAGVLGVFSFTFLGAFFQQLPPDAPLTGVAMLHMLAHSLTGGLLLTILSMLGPGLVISLLLAGLGWCIGCVTAKERPAHSNNVSQGKQ